MVHSARTPATGAVPVTVRQPRAPRPPVRRARVPSVEVRRRRGPRPPDAIVTTLTRALRAALEADAARRAGAPIADAEDDRETHLGTVWRAALAAALVRLVAHARRGVVGALAGTAAAALASASPVTTTPAAELEITDEVEAAVDVHRRRHPGAALEALLAAGAVALGAAVLRLHALLVAAIARAAGASRYVWTTMRDERVRPLHVALEGTIQRWDSPPLAGLPDFHGHPGEAAQCRCQAEDERHCRCQAIAQAS